MEPLKQKGAYPPSRPSFKVPLSLHPRGRTAPLQPGLGFKDKKKRRFFGRNIPQIHDAFVKKIILTVPKGTRKQNYG